MLLRSSVVWPLIATQHQLSGWFPDFRIRKTTPESFAYNGEGCVRVFSAIADSIEDDDDEEYEEETYSTEEDPGKLEALNFKDYDVEFMHDMKMRGKLHLQPFYQRGYKWSQKQASMWIESILRGYPCLPEITLLDTIDEDGNSKYAVFDGQQRLRSVLLFIGNTRSATWPKRKNDDHSFRLEALTILKKYEGKSYQDLPVLLQNQIKTFGIRCAIIPASWSMSDYIDFFKRIQGGGTPMTDHELRRALSQGPFTELLDKLSGEEEVQRALEGCKGLKPDGVQQLLLRYFQYRDCPSRFGKPTLAQNGLETMKRLNKEMKVWTGKDFHRQGDLVYPLKRSLSLILHIFRPNEPFRRPVPLVTKGGTIRNNKELGNVWTDSSKLRDVIWDCTVATFSDNDILKREKEVRDNAQSIRDALILLMQTNKAFTESLRSSLVSTRVHLFKSEVLAIIQDQSTPKSARISPQTRTELIESKRAAGTPCSLCGQPLSPYDDHLHVDHIIPISKGGTSELTNLQVVHKTCNLRKSSNIPDSSPKAQSSRR